MRKLFYKNTSSLLKLDVLSYFLPLLKPFRLHILGLIGIAFIWSVDLWARPYILKRVLDFISDPQYSSSIIYNILPLIIFYFIFGITVILAFRLHEWICRSFIPAFKQKIILDLMQHQMRQPQQYFERNLSGTLGHYVLDTSEGAPAVLSFLIDRVTSYLLGFIGTIGITFMISPIFSLLMTVWIFFFLLVSLRLSKHTMTLSNLVSQKKTNMIGKTIDLLSNMLAVRLFNAQKKEIKNIETWSDDCVKAEKNLDIYLIKLGLFQGMAFILLQVLCWVVLLKGRERGIFTVGDFALILTLNTQIFDSVSRFLEDFSRITVTFGKLTQGLSVLLSPNTSPNPKKLLECKKGVISFHDVSFGYADRPILSKLSLSIPLGQKVGIFGPSGCGKTTLIYLLLGIYKPWSGYITIDGQNINDLSVESLYSLFSFVPQNLCLFNRPFTENISYGHNNPSYKQIKEVIEQSCLNDVAQRHFQSQDNVLNQLSGGEKQRLAIARALLKPSSVCIFDEMSSALDSRTEQKIQENILSYKEKTMIFISHRTSIFECIDRIIVINNGIIMEDGSHQDLMSRESLYRSLVGLL